MIKRNMGTVDRTIRLLVGLVLIPVGLFALGGVDGNTWGQGVTAFAALPLLTAATGFCPLYVPFGISTLERDRVVRT